MYQRLISRDENDRNPIKIQKVNTDSHIFEYYGEVDPITNYPMGFGTRTDFYSDGYFSIEAIQVFFDNQFIAHGKGKMEWVNSKGKAVFSSKQKTWFWCYDTA